MILTIKGADFSGSGLGTNTSVSITLTKGNGVSGSKVSLTLEKNQVVSSATVIATGLSLQTGYENLVVTVTMNGSTVSGWYSNGKITIPSGTTITGNIKITANATKTATGDEPVTPPVDPEEPGTGDSNENLMDVTARLDAQTIFTNSTDNTTQWGAFRGATPVVENDYVKISCENQNNTLSGIRMGVPENVSKLENGTSVEISFYYKKDSSYEPVGEYKFYVTSSASSFKYTNDWQQFKKTYTWDGTWDRLQISSATTQQNEAIFYVKDFCIKITQ